jgi:deoxyribonuclease-4
MHVMDTLYFGTAGKPQGMENESTVNAVRKIADLGLGCLEIEFVRGVQMGEGKAADVGAVARELNIRLSAHAPYFVNLNAREPEKIRASQERILQSARIAAICGAGSVVIHTAFFLGDSFDEAYPTIKKNLKTVLDIIRNDGLNVIIRPEVMGKATQFGTVEEVVRLCSELEGTAPCIDFAHSHAATGAQNSYEEFTAILETVQSALGKSALETMHIHCSGIRYGAKGEQKHLNLEESDFHYRELLQALNDYDVKGLLICESPNLEEDALLMQREYRRIQEKTAVA